MENRSIYYHAKQELGLTECRLHTKVVHKAHINMIFIAETLMNYINWELNKDGANHTHNLYFDYTDGYLKSHPCL
jgi:hypothetical protein